MSQGSKVEEQVSFTPLNYGEKEMGNSSSCYLLPVTCYLNKGFTLVEILIAVTLISLVMAGVLIAFQTSMRSQELAEAREQTYQVMRFVLDTMARDIRQAFIHPSNRDLVFVCIDGSNFEFRNLDLDFDGTPENDADKDYDLLQWPIGAFIMDEDINDDGLLNQGEDINLNQKLDIAIYDHPALGSEKATMVPLGPPDRLDFTTFTQAGPEEPMTLMEVRYCITTSTLDDDLDNDIDVNGNGIPDAEGAPDDDSPPLVGNLDDMIDSTLLVPDITKPYLFGGEVTNDITLFQLRRGFDDSPDDNPFETTPWVDLTNRTVHRRLSSLDSAIQVRQYPALDIHDFTGARGSVLAEFIYDLQFEFYGPIKTTTEDFNDNGVLETNEDVNGNGLLDFGLTEDTGIDGFLDTAERNGSPKGGAGNAFGVDGKPGVAGFDDDGNGVIDFHDAGEKFPDFNEYLWPGSDDVYDPEGDNFDPSLNSIGTEGNGVLESEEDMNGNGRLDTGTALGWGWQDIRGTEDTGPDLFLFTGEKEELNGILDVGEDVGLDHMYADPFDDGSGDPSPISDNDGNSAEPSIGEANGRLDTLVTGIWDSRSPDPRDPSKASELNRKDDDGDHLILQANGEDDDHDGFADDDHTSPFGLPEPLNLSRNGIDDDGDGAIDDGPFDPHGRPEGVDEPDEADPTDDSLPMAVKITIVARDKERRLSPITLTTTVWLTNAP